MAARCDVLILGAGVAGLACAAALRDAGLRVVLIERRATPCGRARSCEDPVTGDRVDLGPHILASEYPNLLSMLDTLGTRDRIVWHEDELLTLLGRTGPVSIRLSPLPAGTESIRRRTETPFPGLLLAGDWTCTSLPACMESAARSGFLAAERILAQEGRARSIAKMPAPPQGIAGIVHRMSAAYRE